MDGVFLDFEDAEMAFAVFHVLGDIAADREIGDGLFDGNLGLGGDVVLVAVDGEDEGNDFVVVAGGGVFDFGFGGPVVAVFLGEIVVHFFVDHFVEIVFLGVIGASFAEGDEEEGLVIGFVGALLNVGKDLLDGVGAFGGVVVEGAAGVYGEVDAIEDEGGGANDEKDNGELDYFADERADFFFSGDLGVFGAHGEEFVHLGEVAVALDADAAVGEDGGVARGAEIGEGFLCSAAGSGRGGVEERVCGWSGWWRDGRQQRRRRRAARQQRARQWSVVAACAAVAGERRPCNRVRSRGCRACLSRASQRRHLFYSGSKTQRWRALPSPSHSHTEDVSVYCEEGDGDSQEKSGVSEM